VLLFRLALCAWCLGRSPAAFAGAWTQAPGGYYLKLAAQGLRAGEYFDASGARVPKPGSGRLSGRGLHAYAEYGLREGLTLVAALPYKRLVDRRRFAGGTGREASRGFGDLELGVRWRLSGHPLVSSLGVGGRVPLGYGVDELTRVPLGTGEPSGEVGLLVGRSLHPVPAYLGGEAGYRARGGAYSGELFWGLEAGLAGRGLRLRGRVSGRRTLGSCEGSGQEGLIGNQDVLEVSPGLGYGLRQGLELEVELSHVAGGCNATAGSALTVGLVLKR
jgi:hypothetical protein